MRIIRRMTALLLTVLLLPVLGQSTDMPAAVADSPDQMVSSATIADGLNAPAPSTNSQSLQECLQGDGGHQVGRFTFPQQPVDPELQALVICSALLEPDEKQYWLDTLPTMTEPQKEQLRDSLAAGLQQMNDPLLQELAAINHQMQAPDETAQ